MQSPFERAALLGLILLNAYSFGANCVERFVNYQTWPLIAAESFKAYHKAQQPLIQIFVVAPLAAGLVLQFWLLWVLPAGFNRAAVLVMAGASAAGAICTVTLQLPIHAALNRTGYSVDLLRSLLRTDWIRKVADLVRLGATAVLLHQIVTAR